MGIDIPWGGEGTFNDVSFGNISGTGIDIEGGSGNFAGNVSFGDIIEGNGILVFGGSGTFNDVSFGNIIGGKGIDIDGGSGNFNDVSFGNIIGVDSVAVTSGIDIEGGSGTFAGNVSFGDISGFLGTQNIFGMYIGQGSGTFNDVSFGDIYNSTGVFIVGDGSGTFTGKVSFGDIAVSVAPSLPSANHAGIYITNGSVTLHDKVSFDYINDNGLGIYFDVGNSKINMKQGAAGVCVDSSCNTSACKNNVCYDAAAREMSGNCIMNGITGPGHVSLCTPT